jgi:adenosine deaminase CECR1
MNYERVFTWYIGKAIDNMIKDGVMYAELRPMLLDKFIPSDDGNKKLDHKWQMQTIIDEVRKKQQELKEQGRFEKFPFGLKIIYCAPRSIPKPMMQKEIQDCIKLKLEFPDLICGMCIAEPRYRIAVILT